MPFERSAGAVIFRREGSKILYLLLKYPREGGGDPFWDLPKGHVEPGEQLIDTARREVQEETGLTDLAFVDEFKEWIKYFFISGGKRIFKIVNFFLAETHTEEVRISDEHIGFAWLPYTEATEKLTYENARSMVRKANEFLAQL